MNKHRLFRKSKRIQGRGFFTDILSKIGNEVKPILEDKTFVRDKLNEILNKSKRGGGLKIYS